MKQSDPKYVMTPFDFLNEINWLKRPDADDIDHQVLKTIQSFHYQSCLSYFLDTIIDANEMNIHIILTRNYKTPTY